MIIQAFTPELHGDDHCYPANYYPGRAGDAGSGYSADDRPRHDGGLLMVATGLRICNIKLFPVANMLPGLVLIMPLSHLWATLVA